MTVEKPWHRGLDKNGGQIFSKIITGIEPTTYRLKQSAQKSVTELRLHPLPNPKAAISGEALALSLRVMFSAVHSSIMRSWVIREVLF